MTEATQPEPTPCPALITHISLKNDGFARHPDTDEGIYIPPAVTNASGLVAGEIRDVHIVPNFPDKRETTPWMGVYVAPPQQAMPEAHKVYDEGGLASFRSTEERGACPTPMPPPRRSHRPLALNQAPRFEC